LGRSFRSAIEAPSRQKNPSPNIHTAPVGDPPKLAPIARNGERNASVASTTRVILSTILVAKRTIQVSVGGVALSNAAFYAEATERTKAWRSGT
jgi:hypothetical protein